MNTDNTEAATTHEDVDAMFRHLHGQTPLPQALVRMFPGGRSAHLTAQILARIDTIDNALNTLLYTKGHGGMNGSELHYMAGLVKDFRHVLAQETADRNATPPCAPLTGTSGRSIVHTIADAISTMPEPKPEDGGWRHAARKQVERTGSYYVQTWERDATYWAYTGQSPAEES